MQCYVADYIYTEQLSGTPNSVIVQSSPGGNAAPRLRFPNDWLRDHSPGYSAPCEARTNIDTFVNLIAVTDVTQSRCEELTRALS